MVVGFTVIGIKLPDVTSVSPTVYMSADCVHVNTQCQTQNKEMYNNYSEF